MKVLSAAVLLVVVIAVLATYDFTSFDYIYNFI